MMETSGPALETTNRCPRPSLQTCWTRARESLPSSPVRFQVFTMVLVARLHSSMPEAPATNTCPEKGS